MALFNSFHCIFQSIIIIIKILRQLRSSGQVFKLPGRISTIPCTESGKVRVLGISFFPISAIELFHFARHTTRISDKSHFTHPISILVGYIQPPFQIINPVSVRHYFRHPTNNHFCYCTLYFYPHRIFLSHPLIILQFYFRNKNKILMIGHIKVIVCGNTIRLYQRLFCHVGST